MGPSFAPTNCKASLYSSVASRPRDEDRKGSGRPSPRARLILARGDQPAQIAVHEHAPGVRALLVAFVRRRQAAMREAELRLVARLGDLEDDVRAFPLVLVLHEAEVSVQHVPDDFLALDEFGYFLS